MTTAPKLPEGLEPVAWGTTRTKDGKQILSEMCVATNPAYVKVHNQHLWDPLVRLSDAQAALQALAAEKDAEIAALKARLNWLANAVLCCDYGDNNAPGEQIGWAVQYSRRNDTPFMFGKSINAAIDSALLAAKEEK